LADEAFLCGSAMEITPIYSIDRYQIGDGQKGKITQVLHSKYLEAVQGKLKDRKSWLTPIY